MALRLWSKAKPTRKVKKAQKLQILKSRGEPKISRKLQVNPRQHSRPESVIKSLQNTKRLN